MLTAVKKGFMLIVGVALIINSNAQQFEWVKTVGSVENELVRNSAIDDYGNIYSAGEFFDTIDIDPGPNVFQLNFIPSQGAPFFIQKLDPLGNFIWGGKINSANIAEIIVDNDQNVIIVGDHRSTTDFDPGPGIQNVSTPSGVTENFVLKLDSGGNFVWVKIFKVEKVLDVEIDNFNNISIIGLFEGTSDFDPGTATFNLTSVGFNDIFTLKLDSMGLFQWAIQLGGTHPQDVAKTLDIDSAGNLYLAGSFNGTVDFNPGGGTHNLTSNGGSGFDAFLLKLNDSGQFIWVRSFGGAHSDFGSLVAVDSWGNSYSTGSFEGVVDFDPGPGIFNLVGDPPFSVPAAKYILKLDSNGNFGWAKKLNGFLGIMSITNNQSNANDIYYSGWFSDTVDFDFSYGTDIRTPGLNVSADAFVSRFDSAGNYVNVATYGSGGSAIAYDVEVFNNNHIYSVGSFRDSADFNPGSGIQYEYAASAGWRDVYVLKLSECTQYTYGNVSLTSCGPFISPSGKQFPNTGVFVDTMLTYLGCDSIVTLDLTIHASPGHDTTISTCNSYIFGDSILHSSGQYSDTLLTVNGCDSIINLDLILNKTFLDTSITACLNYFWNGTLYESTGQYYDTLVNASGCDSIITLDLTIDTINSFITNFGSLLVSQAPNANYEWIDCQGESWLGNNQNQTFVPQHPGVYAVIVEENGCVDTSDCTEVILLSNEIEVLEGLKFYQSPYNGNIQCVLSNPDLYDIALVSNALGEIIAEYEIYSPTLEIEINGSAGLYFIRLIDNNKNERVFKFFKLN